MRDKRVFNFEPLLIGSISGAVSTSALQPLDVIKTRIQIVRTTSTSNWRTNVRLTPLIQEIVRHDGVAGLWKGLCPSLLRAVPGAGIYFACLHSLAQEFCPNNPSPAQSLLVGMCSRSIAGVATMPFSILKTRYESGIYSYDGVIKALLKIFQQEGFRGIFRGCLAILSRDVPYSGLYVMVYNSSKKFLAEDLCFQPSTTYFFACAAFAGFMSSLITHPPDVIKTHIQTYPGKCDSYYRACKVIVKDFGYSGFFRGLAPRLAKKTIMSTISWTTFEKIMNLIQRM